MVIVFVSDHGEGFYEHGIQGHGWDLYGESIQVPLILKPPRTSSGKRVPELAQQIDLLPTLLELEQLPEVESLEFDEETRQQLKDPGPKPSKAGRHKVRPVQPSHPS